MKKMKVLIAYDGSEFANAAIEDLKLAGLPRTGEALVMTVADVFVPPPGDEEVDNTSPVYVPDSVRRAHQRAQTKLEQAAGIADQAGKKVKESFPEWDVRHEALADSPAWALV